MSAGSTRPLHVDIKFMWWDPEEEGWLSTQPPSTERSQLAMVTTVSGADAELARDAEQEGLQIVAGGGIMPMMPTYSADFFGQTAIILGAAGGIGGIAAVLKVFFERNNGKKVTFGQDGEVLGVEGLSADEIVHLLETLRDQRVEEESARSGAQKQNVLEAVAEQASDPSFPHRSRLRGIMFRLPPR